MNLEKTQMLTVAMTHLTYDTLENFAKICANSGKLVCYPKSDYGYFVYLLGEPSNLDIPSDLKTILKLAFDEDCSLVCFDCDGFEIEGFETYHH